MRSVAEPSGCGMIAAVNKEKDLFLIQIMLNIFKASCQNLQSLYSVKRPLLVVIV